MAFNFFKRRNNDDSKDIKKSEVDETPKPDARERRLFPFGSDSTKPAENMQTDVPTASSRLSPEAETDTIPTETTAESVSNRIADIKAEVVEPTDSQSASKPMNESTQSTAAIMPEALIRRGRKLFLDSTAMRSVGFVSFIDNYSELFKARRNSCFIPEFELALLPDDESMKLRSIANNGVFTILKYEGVGNYKDFIAKISVMGREKGQLCFVTDQSGKAREIISAARAAGIFVQLFSVSDEGKLCQSAARPTSGEGKKSERPTRATPPTGSTESHDRFTLTTVPERITLLPIKPNRSFGKGDTVYDSNKRAIRLAEQEIVNPNAVTYSTDISGSWAKIYDVQSLNTFHEEKVKRMLSKKVEFPGLCWPTDILRDSDGNFVGMLMPPSKGEPLQLSIFKQAKLQTYFPDWTKKDLCELTLTILRTIKYLHGMNILMGCINPAAIRVADKDTVYFVDTDNYQIEGFPTLIYNTSFTPPELQGRKIYLCTKENENYAVAMLVFMLMMPGKTPYTINPDQSISDAVSVRSFPFTYGSFHGNHAMPGMWRFMWSHLTPLKDVFYNTFQKGGKLELPESRKTVGNWIGFILRFCEELENPTDPESLKLYPRTFKRTKNKEYYTCEYCGVSHPKFYFNSRYFDDCKICNECIDKRSNVSFTCKACGKTYYYTNRTALYHKMMKKTDSEWKDQKYCRDCKSKTLRCVDCGVEMPYFYLNNGRCKSCRERKRNGY